MSEDHPHQSVLLDEVLDVFAPCEFGVYVDGTLGAGGHSEAMLARYDAMETLVGIDQDPTALEIAGARLQQWSEKVQFCRGNFASLDDHLDGLGIDKVDAILVDLGVSSMQLDRAERGFSFSKDGPLDMRMNPDGKLTAADIVNTWEEGELGRIFREYGEEKHWRLAARRIVEARAEGPIETTAALVNILYPVLRARGADKKKKKINPLTLVFQALRIAVNGELDVLAEFLPRAIERLRPGGRLAVISFHRLEDRVVKRLFREEASDKQDTAGLGGVFLDKEPIVRLVSRKAIKPSEAEIEVNARSRSARMRVVEKL